MYSNSMWKRFSVFSHLNTANANITYKITKFTIMNKKKKTMEELTKGLDPNTSIDKDKFDHLLEKLVTKKKSNKKDKKAKS